MAEPLTIAHSAAVTAAFQRLLHKAETGEDADEHTIALRMLGSSLSQPEDPLAFLQTSPVSTLSLNSADGDKPSGGDDKFGQLKELLMGDTKTPKEQVASGLLPKAPVVSILPNYDSTDVSSNYASLQDASSMCQLYVNLMKVEAGKAKVDITDVEAASKEFANQANYTYTAMTGPLAGFFNFKEGATKTFNNTIKKSDIHENFLGNIFKAYQFDEKTTKSLDGILTDFVSALKTVNSEKSPKNTQDFCLRLLLVPKINVAGDDKDPIFVYQPTLYIIYMKIAGTTYSKSISKNNSVDQVDFSFQLITTKCELNVKKFEANREKFDKIFNLVTDMNLRAYSELLNKKVTSTQANPGASA